MTNEMRATISKLSDREKMLLALDLWNELADSPEALAFTDEQLQLLDQRISHYRENPDDFIPWDEAVRHVREQVRSKGKD